VIYGDRVEYFDCSEDEKLESLVKRVLEKFKLPPPTVNWQVFHPTWEKVRLLEHHKTLKDCGVKDGDTIVIAHVHVVGSKTSKIPFELFCFNCLTHLEWTGHDSGEYLVYRCPKCGYMLGVKLKR
jgi:uncharacterized ubiquitin-like protein YukD